MNDPSEDYESEIADRGAPSESHLERKARIGRLIKILVAAIAVSLVVALATFFYLYRTATAVVPEYEAMLVVAEEPEVVEQERQRFESQVTSLISESQIESDWQMSVTEREINAWLATRIASEMPELEQNGLSDPRLMITAEAITLAIRSRVGSTRGVLSLKVVPFATEGGELALKMIEAKIGQLPMPVGRVVGLIEKLIEDKKLPLRVLQEAGMPIVIVNLAALSDNGNTLPKLVGFDLREDALLIRGESESLSNASPSAEATAEDPEN